MRALPTSGRWPRLSRHHSRVMAAAAGLGVLGAAWLGPLPTLARDHFAAHMTMHMLVVVVAAPLLAIALAATRFDPVVRRPGLFNPVVFSFVELLVVWSWHAPALHHAARQNAAALTAEQGTFLLSGILLWLAATGGPDPLRRRRAAAGAVALLLTSMHMTLLGALFALAPRPVYAHGDPSAAGALGDQELGGAIMLLAGGLAYLAGGIVLARRVLTDKPQHGHAT